MHTEQPDIPVLKSVKCLTSISMPFDSLIHERKKTRRFSNHVSRLLSRSHTFAIIVILDLKIHQSMWIHWLFFPKTWNQRSLTPRWPLTPCLLRSHVWLYPRIIVSKSHDNTWICGYSDQFCKIPHTYIHILRTYYIHTTYYVQNERSHSLLLNSVQARQLLNSVQARQKSNRKTDRGGKERK